MCKLELRPRQREFVDRVKDSVAKHGNTVGIAATGSGKTAMFSKVVEELSELGAEKTLVVQGRDVLVKQNRSTLHDFTDNLTSSVFDSKTKDFGGDVVYGMAQSLSTTHGLKRFLPVDVCVVDEVHMSCCPTYYKIRDRLVELNKDTKFIGVTATPARSDKKGLMEFGFNNVADRISAAEMIEAGYLVPPKTYVIDSGNTEKLKLIRDDDNDSVAEILNNPETNKLVVQKWRELANGRQTIVFCGNVKHAEDVNAAFIADGIRSDVIHGGMTNNECEEVISRLEKMELDVVVNVYKAVAGMDHQPISCVMILRKEAFHSSYTQMIGRGLRIVNPDKFPGIDKSDCIVIDLGMSTLKHGTLEGEVDIYSKKGGGLGAYKVCPVCEGEIPASQRTCPLCGYSFPFRNKEKIKVGLEDFTLTEVDILNSSPWSWVWVTQDGQSCMSGQVGTCMMAGGFDSWACVVWTGQDWVACGGRERNVKLLFRGSYVEALNAGDTYLLNFERTGAASKMKAWLNLEPTEKQIDMLNRLGYKLDLFERAGDFRWRTRAGRREGYRPDVHFWNGVEVTRYVAQMLTHLAWNKSRIKELI